MAPASAGRVGNARAASHAAATNAGIAEIADTRKQPIPSSSPWPGRGPTSNADAVTASSANGIARPTAIVAAAAIGALGFFTQQVFLRWNMGQDLRQALIANTTALDAWRDITPLARNEFICWVEDAKQETTRERRIRRTWEELEEGKRRPCCWPGCKHRERNGR